ncbi:uncharacterized protein PHALS_13952 [Plasmopara halstedii]|uniref:MYND-type domain-containing protein n=1 Tax=Plasmopara halstedii TaxID=4781 RepID=A0A0P1ARU2_PLAHL|nr:uncharacterized protein PHALS_13952 [Plasmopara halstedii]CEG43654.1 hypothetical protein PHALS_13952 [Plasmopara halstedii]|eukprot:XP_024580023.1 hypothetical protein PHALS_13952 [Plasmopara halstedii]
MGKRHSGLKRKAGHLGFQAGEIAFIEDEMAALAAEYGLEVDRDIASHVQQRKERKKTRRRRHHDETNNIRGIDELQVREQSKETIKLLDLDFNNSESVDIKDAHKLVLTSLTVVLPDTCALRACGVPGCACSNGSRSLGFPEEDSSDKNQRKLIEKAQCLSCQHGVLQHVVEVREDADLAATLPSGGQRLLQTLYQIIRLGRIGASILKSRIWTKSALERLEAVLTHLKKQFADGGTRNGQKSAGEVHRGKQLLTNLQAQLRQAHQSVGLASRDELPIALACICDQMYFQTYYSALVLYGRACGAVPSPDKYFKELEQFTQAGTSQFEAFLNHEFSGPDQLSRVLKTLEIPIVGSTSHDEMTRERLRLQQQHRKQNPLLSIFHARLREGVRLFYEEGVGMNGEMDAILKASQGGDLGSKKHSNTKKHPQKKHYRRERKAVAQSDVNVTALKEMPCYPLLAQWRDNCRDWCCHLYSYATPNQEALEVMAKYAPIVEIGAGTGYWCSLLQRAGVDVVAFDNIPPSGESTQENAYHGHVPPFCSVQCGGPEILSQQDIRNRSLFLCYPPPGDTMAVRSIQLFQGDVVLHVGEWQGDTGDSRFENELQRRFVLEQEILLPNWGNSAYGLTVWRRKAKNLNSVAWRAMSCFNCDKTLQEAVEKSVPLRRCVICKTNVYCSSICARQDAMGHTAEHAMRLVFLKEPISSENYDRNFDNEAYYTVVKEPDLDDTIVAFKNNWREMTKIPLKAKGSDDEENLNRESIIAKTPFAFNFSS